MKKLYAIILILIFSIQALPLERVGKLLGSGVLNEEIQHSTTSAKTFFEEDQHFQYNNHLSSRGEENIKKQSFIAYDERVNQHPFLDIFLQPPNLI